MKHFAFCILVIISTIWSSWSQIPSTAPTTMCHPDGRSGKCEPYYNIPECDYDDGDCCEESCNATGTSYEHVGCGYWGYDCKDPLYTLPPSSSPTTNEPTKSPSNIPTVYTPCVDEYIGNALCDAAYNNAECSWDGGDCCSATCRDYTDRSGTSVIHNECGMDWRYPYDCKDPEYGTPSPTSIIGLMMGIGGTYKAVSSNSICIDHTHGSFLSIGNWKLSTERTLKRVDLDYPSEYYSTCLVNNTLSTCDEAEYISPDEMHLLTYCCASKIWIVGESQYEGVEEGSTTREEEFYYFSSSKTGDIGGLDTWYDWSTFDEYDEYNGVRLFEGSCYTAGLIISAVLLVIFLCIFIVFCCKLGVKNISDILDAFETQAARIELMIVGVCFGDSFISSIFISIPLPLTSMSKGIIVMCFGVVSFILFGVRLYLTKPNILESETIGSLSDFTFDFALGIFLIFMHFDIGAGIDMGNLTFFAFLFVMGTYAGVVEEFLQLLSHIKCECLHKVIGWYLRQSGRVLSTVNMFLLFWMSLMYCVTARNALGWAIGCLVVSLVIFCASCYSWYAYVGCCGKGGHKKADYTAGNTSGDKPGDTTGDKAGDAAGDTTGDKAADAAGDRADNTSSAP